MEHTRFTDTLDPSPGQRPGGKREMVLFVLRRIGASKHCGHVVLGRIHS